MTERQIAAESGYSNAMVHKKLKKGHLPEEIISEGRARQKAIEKVQKRPADGKRPVSTGGKRPSKPSNTDESADPEHPKDDEDYWSAQKRKEIALANLRELELAQKRKELVSAAEVATTWATICTTIRDGMLSLPMKTNDKEILAFLRSEIRSELTRISHDLD
jgi:hypothetical protein